MKFLLYLLRWQLSTPILWVCLTFLMSYTGELMATVLANIIGGCVFYFVDKRIFGGVK